MSHFFAIFAYEVGLLILAVLVAYYQAWRIKPPRNKHIYHGWWTCLWVVSTGFTAWALWADLHQSPLWAEEMPSKLIPWVYGVATGCGHLVVFNICLNRFRGLSWKYTSISTGSILDHLELVLFGNRIWVMEKMLGIVWIVLQLFFLCSH